MDFKRSAPYLLGGVLALALWLAWLWQPERQVRLHTASLLRAVERRNWEKAGNLLADSYSDRWGHDKEFVLSSLRQVFGQFIFLRVEHDAKAIGEGRATARVKVSGTGGPVAQLVMEKVNGLGGPFTFTWVKRSGRPWDWGLTAVDHPSLDLDSAPQF